MGPPVADLVDKVPEGLQESRSFLKVQGLSDSLGRDIDFNAVHPHGSAPC